MDRLQTLALCLANAGAAIAPGGAVVILLDRNPINSKAVDMKVATAGIPNQIAANAIVQQLAKNMEASILKQANAEGEA